VYAVAQEMLFQFKEFWAISTLREKQPVTGPLFLQKVYAAPDNNKEKERKNIPAAAYFLKEKAQTNTLSLSFSNCGLTACKSFLVSYS
jgi:hypothetical protein